MSVRNVLILSLLGAVVLVGSVVAIAQIDNGESPQERPASPTPTDSSPSESPQATSSSPAAAPGSPSAPPRPAPPPNPAPPASFPDPAGYRPAMVEPRPGMENVHPIPWRRAEPIGARTVRVHFESGVAPCNVLDRVEVDYGSSITITLFEGSDPAFPDAACIMIAQYKAVDVPLSEPLNGRPLVDGGK